MVLMYEFAQREEDVKINVCYLGQASTNMTRSVTPEMLLRAMRWMLPIFKLMVRDDGGALISVSCVFARSGKRNGKIFRYELQRGGMVACGDGCSISSKNMANG